METNENAPNGTSAEQNENAKQEKSIQANANSDLQTQSAKDQAKTDNKGGINWGAILGVGGAILALFLMNKFDSDEKKIKALESEKEDLKDEMDDLKEGFKKLKEDRKSEWQKERRKEKGNDIGRAYFD